MLHMIYNIIGRRQIQGFNASVRPKHTFYLTGPHIRWFINKKTASLQHIQLTIISHTKNAVIKLHNLVGRVNHRRRRHECTERVQGPEPIPGRHRRAIWRAVFSLATTNPSKHQSASIRMFVYLLVCRTETHMLAIIVNRDRERYSRPRRSAALASARVDCSYVKPRRNV